MSQGIVVNDITEDIDVGVDEGLGLVGTIVAGEIVAGAIVLDSTDAQRSSEKQNIPSGQTESLQVGAVSHVKSN